jgi:hypothetical protein
LEEEARPIEKLEKLENLLTAAETGFSELMKSKQLSQSVESDLPEISPKDHGREARDL